MSPDSSRPTSRDWRLSISNKRLCSAAKLRFKTFRLTSSFSRTDRLSKLPEPGESFGLTN